MIGPNPACAGRDALPRVRRCTSEKGEHLVKMMAKSLSSCSARARSQKQKKKRRDDTAPDARERIPTGAGEVARSYHFYGAYQRLNSNQKQGLRGGSLERLI